MGIAQRDVFRDPKFYVFIGLLLVLVIVNLNPWRRSAQTIVSTKQDRAGNQQRVTGDPILMAEKLTAERSEFHQEKRNIFAFYNTPPVQQVQNIQQPEEIPPPPDPICGNGACEPGEDLTNCAADCQPPPPPPPVFSLRYIGYMSEPNGSVAFLTDGKEVYMGRVNDVIANQYRVLKITEDSVELGFLNNNQSGTIRFQGSQGD